MPCFVLFRYTCSNKRAFCVLMRRPKNICTGISNNVGPNHCKYQGKNGAALTVKAVVDAMKAPTIDITCTCNQSKRCMDSARRKNCKLLRTPHSDAAPNTKNKIGKAMDMPIVHNQIPRPTMAKPPSANRPVYM